MKKNTKQLTLWNTPDNKDTKTLGSLFNRWEEITGKPDNGKWLWNLKNHITYNKKDYWSTPFNILVNWDFNHIAKLKRDGKIGDVFMYVKDHEDKKAVALFLRRKGFEKDTLETLFSPEVLLPLDQNEEPEPARERDFDLNKRPRLEQDLNQNPPQEVDEAGDDGGE